MCHVDQTFRFCPVCGGKLDVTRLKENDPARLMCSDCKFVFYLDPKLVVCSIVERNGRIALLKRNIEPQKGKWAIPGGYVDRGETLVEATIRETKEEVNLEVCVEKLLNVYSYPGRSVILAAYTVRVVGGDLKPGDEAAEVGTFGPGEIPWRVLAFPSTRDALEEYLRVQTLENH